MAGFFHKKNLEFTPLSASSSLREDDEFNQKFINLLLTSKNDFSKFSKIEGFKDLFLIISDLKNCFSFRECHLRINFCEGRTRIIFQSELSTSYFLNKSYYRIYELEEFIESNLNKEGIYSSDFKINNYTKKNLYSLLKFTESYIKYLNGNKTLSIYFKNKIDQIDLFSTPEDLLRTYEFKYDFKFKIDENRRTEYSEVKREMIIKIFLSRMENLVDILKNTIFSSEYIPIPSAYLVPSEDILTPSSYVVPCSDIVLIDTVYTTAEIINFHL